MLERVTGRLLLAAAGSPFLAFAMSKLLEAWGCSGAWRGKRGARPICEGAAELVPIYQAVTDFWVVAAYAHVVSVPLMVIFGIAGVALLRTR